MRKILLMAGIALCAILVQAETYSYLVFTNTAGTTTAFSVPNLTLTVEGSNLRVKNDEGTVNLVLADLAAMQFSATGTLTAVENVLLGDEPVQIFSVSGVRIGSFGSLLEAAQQLSADAYVISNGKNSQTIVVR